MKAASFLAILARVLSVVSAYPVDDGEFQNTTIALENELEARVLRPRGGWTVGKHYIAGESASGLYDWSTGLTAISRTPETIQLFYARGSAGLGYGALTEIHWEEGEQWKYNPMKVVLGSVTVVRGPMVALSRRGNREEVFYYYDGSIMSHYWDGTWHSSEDKKADHFGGGKIAALAMSGSDMEIFWVGNDGGTIRNSYWSEGGKWTTNKLVEAWEAKAHNREIVAVKDGSEKWVFWMMKTGEIKSWHWIPSTGWWSGPHIRDANAWGGLAIISRKPGEKELFWIGRDKKVYHSYSSGYWKTSRLISDVSAEANLGVVSRHENHMELFWVRPDGAIHHAYWVDGQWKNEQLSGAGPGTCHPQSEIAVISRKSNTIEGWCGNSNSELIHFYWYA